VKASINERRKRKEGKDARRMPAKEGSGRKDGESALPTRSRWRDRAWGSVK
jgi:hypothetical protein